jgi:hypothetical protein
VRKVGHTTCLPKVVVPGWVGGTALPGCVPAFLRDAYTFGSSCFAHYIRRDALTSGVLSLIGVRSYVGYNQQPISPNMYTLGYEQTFCTCQMFRRWNSLLFWHIESGHELINSRETFRRPISDIS